MVRPRQNRRAGLAALVLSLANPAFSATPASESQPAVPPFVLPPVHYSAPLSFRGVLDGGKLQGFDISGHATGLPGVHDYLRLVPANPLAHGALFTQQKMEAEEWIAEIAFRVHGPPAVGLVDVSEEDGVPAKSTRVHKGGRGLAFWVTKTGNESPLTISTDPKAVLSAPPPFIPQTPTDPSDDKVSFFGYQTQFDGLGIVFDTSPTSPVFARSDSHNWVGTTTGVVGSSGVVSGILDDGSGMWLEPKGRVMKDDEEAAYLDKAIGECEAAFRNAQGLLWARISYVNQTIRVDLDLAPHTTLAKAGRDYAHNCFSLSGIKIPPGSYFGLTGLASGNAEPDSVDVYAMDVFEVLKIQDGSSAPATDEPAELRQKQPLEGTSDDAVSPQKSTSNLCQAIDSSFPHQQVSSLAHEIFLSQARMVEAIDALARRVEYLSRNLGNAKGGSGAVPGASANAALMSRLTGIETRLSELAAREGGAAAPPPAAHSDDTDSVKHILQLQDRLMVELKAFGRKLDTASSQSIGSLATLSSRSAESLQLLQRAVSTLDESIAGSRYSWLWWAFGLGGVGSAVWYSRRNRDGGYGKKMI